MARWMMAVAMIAVLAPVPASAALWLKVGTDKRGAILSIDNSAVVYTGDQVSAPAKWDYRAVATEKYPTKIDQMLFDCRAKTFRLVETTYYDSEGKAAPKGKQAAETPMRAIPEGTIADKVYKKLCISDT